MCDILGGATVQGYSEAALAFELLKKELVQKIT